MCSEAQGHGKHRIGAGFGTRTQCFSVSQACGGGWEGAMGVQKNEIAEEDQVDNKDFHKATF